MKIIQLIGPYRSDTVSGIQDNITYAARWAKHYWKQGHAVICPHMNSSFFDGSCPDEIFLSGYKEIIARLDPEQDELITLSGWTNSSGSKEEVALGLELGIPITYKGELP